MYYLLGLPPCLGNLVALSEPFAENGNRDLASLRRAYLDFLRETQPALPGALPAEFEIRSYSTGERDWRSLFGYDEDAPAWSDQPAAWDARALEQGEGAIGRIDPSLHDLLRAATAFTYSPSTPEGPGSGTLYRGNGAMYINPRPEWSTGDVVETYLHELTHILLVLDEYRFGHYLDYDAMALPEHFLHTAILSRLQPLHLCFHSAAVAYEILAARPHMDELGVSYGIHGPSGSLRQTTTRTVNELLEAERASPLMTARGRELLETLSARLAELR